MDWYTHYKIESNRLQEQARRHNMAVENERESRFGKLLRRLHLS